MFTDIKSVHLLILSVCYRLTALHASSQNGHLDVVRYLTQNGVKVNLSANIGRTALHVASLKGHSDVVEHLMKISTSV